MSIHGGNKLSSAMYKRVIARVIWLVVAALMLALFVATLPVHGEHMHTICEDITCSGSPTHAELTSELRLIGVTFSFYTVYTLTLQILFLVGCYLVAVLIFYNKPDDRVSVLVSLFLMIFAIAFIDVPHTLTQTYPAWRWPIAGIGLSGEMLLPLCFYLFPNGQFAPRWTSWLLIGWLAWGISNYFFPGASFKTYSWFLWVDGLAFIVGVGSLITTQVYRYRHLSNPTQRQQTRWVLFGAVSGLSGFISAGIVGFMIPHMLFTGSDLRFQIVIGILANTVNYLAMLLIPLSIGIAILRSRLWDIDVLINRTLVYASLTLLLALSYFACVIGFQFLLQELTAEVSQASLVVLSTLVIAALFHPLRRRIQQFIDRCFYRKNYDAARTLGTFGTVLQSEVDLERLSEQLVTIIQETFQPEHVSLWLYVPAHGNLAFAHPLASLRTSEVTPLIDVSVA